jgi:hypothetical protein
LWLLGCFGVQGFRISWGKIGPFVSRVGSSFFGLGSLGCFKESLSHELVKVCKNSQTLWQHMNNDHKERKKTW